MKIGSLTMFNRSSIIQVYVSIDYRGSKTVLYSKNFDFQVLKNNRATASNNEMNDFFQRKILNSRSLSDFHWSAEIYRRSPVLNKKLLQIGWVVLKINIFSSKTMLLLLFFFKWTLRGDNLTYRIDYSYFIEPSPLNFFEFL